MVQLKLTKDMGTNPLIYLNGILFTRQYDYEIKGDILTFLYDIKPVNSIINVINPVLLYREVLIYNKKSFRSVSKEYFSSFNPNININQPKNNDGRSHCFWCNSPTKKVQSFNGSYDVCKNCGR